MKRRAGIAFIFILISLVNKVYAQDEDLIGFKGGYKALSRLCVQNLDNASHLLANDYSRGYIVSISISSNVDTVSDILFLTATPAEMAKEITWALKGTNGQWIRRAKGRKILVPIFFCQNTPPNDSMFSQLLVTNNVGFSVPHFPDQWPEAVEGVWIHPICPLVSSGTPRNAPVVAAPAPVVTAPATAVAAAPTVTVPATATPAAPVASAPVAAAPAAGVPANDPAATGTLPQAPAGYILTRAPGPIAPDTVSASGIFKTKDQFDKGEVTFGSTSPVEEKGLLSWFNIEYAAYGTVRVKLAGDKQYQEFSVGSVFGFKSDNISYVYLKSLKEYLAVIKGNPPFYLFMDERKQSGYNGATTVDGVFMFARSLDGPVKEFTRKAIDTEFGSNPQMASDLQVLRKEMNRHSLSMTRGDFEACRQLAGDYLKKWETAAAK